MPDFSIAKLMGYNLSQDGRDAVLRFGDSDGDELALQINTLDLQVLVQEIGALLSKAAELSDIYKSDVVPFFRPEKFRANLATGPTVVMSFLLNTGLESHFGLSPESAERLANQMLEKAQEGKIAKPKSRN